MSDPLPLPFIDDMESGPGGWTATGFWNLVVNPHLQNGVIAPIVPDLVTLPDPGFLPPPHSGSGAWWYGESATGTFIGADFDPGQQPGSGGRSMAPNTGSLISPPLDLTAATNGVLRFASWWEIEGVDVNTYDLMFVEISTDGGSTFEPLGKLNPINDVDGESFIPFSSGGLGEPGVWNQYIFDLTPWVGNTVQIRFRFDTVDALYNGFRGWFIDDVLVGANQLVGPQLVDLAPAAGSQGTIITLHGANFVNGAVVSFAIGEPPTVVTAETAVIGSQLATALVPFLAEGLYDVTITNPDGLSDTIIDGFASTAALAPDVSAIDPVSQVLGAVTSVTITGSNFDPAALASIGGFPLANQVNGSDTQITGDISGLPQGSHNVRVENPDGQFDVLVNAFEVSLPSAGTRTVELPDATISGGQFASFVAAILTDGLTNEGIGKIRVSLEFDPEVIDIIDIRPGADFPDFYTIQFERAGGVATATLLGLPPAGPGTELLQIGVVALDVGTSPLTWSSLVFNDDTQAVHTLVDGSVTISAIDTEPPQVTQTTRLPDTSDPFGPYPVQAQVFDNESIAFVDLLYRLQGEELFTRVPMTLLEGQGTLSGLVTDSGQNPLANAALDFFDAEGTLVTSEFTGMLGYFAVMLPAGPGVLNVSAPGFLPASVTFHAVPGGNTSLGTIILAADVAGISSLSGVVLSAADGTPVEGADVVLREGLFTSTGPAVASTTSDADGFYEFLDLAAGSYTLEVSKLGFITSLQNVSMSGQDVVRDMVISPVIAADALRIVLSWGSEPPAPPDLDAHLSGPTVMGDRFHVAYFNPGALDSEPFAALDVDDVTFSGPETITIPQLRSGTYRYWVHNYTDYESDITDGPGLANAAQAVVRVYQGSQLLETFLPLPGELGNTWMVFELDGDTGTITPIHTFANSTPSDVLSEGASVLAAKPYAALWAQAGGGATLQSETGLYGADIPGMPPGSVVEYYVEATDGVGNHGTEPLGAPMEVITFRVIGDIGASLSIPLVAGWNLVSWNVDPADDSIVAVAAPVADMLDRVLGFETTEINPNPQEAGAKIYDPDLPAQINTLNLTAPRLGYWFRMLGPATLVISGVPVNPVTPIPLVQGWNLVSYLPNVTDSVTHAVESVHIALDRLVGFETPFLNPNPPGPGAKLYDPDLPPFVNTLNLMAPGLGYWFRMLAPAELTYPSTLAGAVAAQAKPLGAAKVESPVHPTWEWMGIYGELSVDGKPAPVGTVVDVVDGAGSVAGLYEVQRDGWYGYLPIYRDDLDSQIDEGAEPGEWLNLRVNGQLSGTRVQWTQFGEVVQVDLALANQTAEVRPTAFALIGNYPNPFNPGTTIAYTLPGEMEVSLTVYSLSGQAIRQMVAGRQAAGFYRCAWDGRDEAGRLVASGTYLYRLEAGEFSATKKLLLLK